MDCGPISWKRDCISSSIANAYCMFLPPSHCVTPRARSSRMASQQSGEPASEMAAESVPEPSSEAHSAATSQSVEAAEPVDTARKTIESNEPPPESISTAQAPSSAEEPADSNATP